MIDVILKLENSARARLSWIQSFAASFGIVPKPIYGHIALCSVEQGDLEACKAAVMGQKAFPVDFEQIDVLPNGPVVAALAARTGALEDLHEKLCGSTDWIPCVELLRDPMVNMGWVRSAMREMFKPFTAQVVRLEFMENGTLVDGVDLEREQAEQALDEIKSHPWDS